MFRLYAFWSAPANPGDTEEFDRLYRDRHAAIASKVPGMRRFITSRTDVGLEGTDPAFYRVAEMIFDSRDDLERAEHSDEWQALRQDAGQMIERFGVTMTVAMGEETEQPVAA
jgi:uncharacterized protein (TIGR02118 family)